MEEPLLSGLVRARTSTRDIQPSELSHPSPPPTAEPPYSRRHPCLVRARSSPRDVHSSESSYSSPPPTTGSVHLPRETLIKYTESNVLERVPDENGKRLVGECKDSHELYWIVTERIKRLVRSMIQEADDLHRIDYCLPKFTHNNWEVTGNGLAVFKGLSTLKKTDQLVAQNYDNLHSVILKIIFRKFTMQQIPADFRSLLYLMKHERINNGYLIRNCAALIPLENRILFFMKAYEHISFHLARKDADMKEEIMKKLPYSKRWFEMLKGNHLLEYSLNYKTRDVSGSAEGFMEFYRDSNYHRMDKNFQILEVGGYEAEEFELLCLVKYPLYLTSLQEALHANGQLEGLRPHTLFSFDPSV
ncbi:hypothetical protein BS78_04G021000 [Paspalum vaginatum]|nr:hypothetical protein BS78_04G021000 [Paspalum vaginatum]